MILIADGGSTKTEWCLWDIERKVGRNFLTEGMNPYFQTSKDLRAVVEESLLPQLIGFDDISLSSLISPELTTIKQPLDEMAKMAMERVLNQGATEERGGRHILPVSLIVRETTRRKDEYG